MTAAAGHEIESIVRLVLDRLRLANVTARDQALLNSADASIVNKDEPIDSTPGHKTDVQNNLPAHQPGHLVLAGSLVTLSDLQERLDQIHTLQVASRTLLTPSVKDELRRRNIQVVRTHPSDLVQRNAVDPNSPNRLDSEVQIGRQPVLRIVAAESKLPVIGAIAKKLSLQNLLAQADEAAVVKSLLSHESQSLPTVWCATRPYAAVQACRDSAGWLRVVGLHQLVDLAQAVHEVNPNVLILDDRRWSGHQVGQLVLAWSRIAFSRSSGAVQ